MWAQSLSPNGFTREGFTFDGWNTAADGSGKAFADKAAVTVYTDAILYAQWKQNVPVGSAPVITSPTTPQTVAVYEGEQGTMTITAIGATGYQWYINRHDGLGYVPISGAVSPSYTTSAVNMSNDGFTYYCVASNAYGDAQSPTFLLQVMETIEIPETGDGSNIALWIVLGLVSLTGLLVTWRSGKRKYNET